MGLYDLTLGTLLVGIFLNTYLYGLVAYQFAAYYQRKFNDLLAVKCMVLSLFVLDTFHSCALVYHVWYVAVENFGNPAVFAELRWPLVFSPGGNALAAFVTQIYLGFRIWRLTNSNILYGMVLLLAIPSFILGMMCSIESCNIKVLSGLTRITSLVIAWLTMQVITDTFITVTLVIIFSRSRTGLGKMDTVLNRLIRGTIQTGLFASIFALGDLVTFLVIPSSNLFALFVLPLGRIYTNTLLDGLLTRESLREEMNGTYGMCRDIKSLHWTTYNPLQSSTTAQSTSIQPSLQKIDHETCDCSLSKGVDEVQLAV